ncbi:MAG: metallophosphoesterase [Anaerolinea sp.]|nr:metallophosphoesterase [Anaerolinea sp.]
MDRRNFLKLAATGAAAGLGAAALGAGWATLIEPNWPVVEQIGVTLPRLPARLEGLRVAQLSDLHISSYTTAGDIERAAALAMRQSPDVIVLTGDFIWREVWQYAEELVEPLRTLRAPLGVYAVLGNHDHWEDAALATRVLGEAGVTLLLNQAVRLETDAPLWLAGLDDVWERKHDMAAALAGAPDDECKLLLVHEPDYADEAARYPVDLQLSGHSHGGQINLPGYGRPVLPYLGRKYPAGLYQVGPLALYTNRGIGVIAPPVRFNCPPEVTLLTLHP